MKIVEDPMYNAQLKIANSQAKLTQELHDMLKDQQKAYNLTKMPAEMNIACKSCESAFRNARFERLKANKFLKL